MKHSQDAATIFDWLLAIDTYKKVMNNIIPKEKLLMETSVTLKEKEMMLLEKNANLKKIQEYVDKMQ